MPSHLGSSPLTPRTTRSSASPCSPPSRAFWIRACQQLPIFEPIMHQNAGFCIINIIFPSIAIRDSLCGRETPTTPTPMPLSLAQSWCPSASFRLATAFAIGYLWRIRQLIYEKTILVIKSVRKSIRRRAATCNESGGRSMTASYTLLSLNVMYCVVSSTCVDVSVRFTDASNGYQQMKIMKQNLQQT